MRAFWCRLSSMISKAITSSNTPDLCPDYIFISCGSFEERCIRSSAIIFDKRTKIRDSIIFNYKETDPKNKKEENMKEMIKNLEQVSDSVHVFDTGSVSLPTEGIKRFLRFLRENHLDLSSRRVTTDITVFTKPYFFLMESLRRGHSAGMEGPRRGRSGSR